MEKLIVIVSISRCWGVTGFQQEYLQCGTEFNLIGQTDAHVHNNMTGDGQAYILGRLVGRTSIENFALADK